MSAFTRIAASTIGTAGGATNATSGSINSTGADFLLAIISNANASPGISDSKGNTFVEATIASGQGTTKTHIFYCNNPTSVGSGHSVTTTGAQYASVQLIAYSGAANATPLLGIRANSTNDKGVSFPVSQTKCLIVSSFVWQDSATMSVAGGSLAIVAQQNWSSGANMGLAVAEEIQTSGGTGRLATWTPSAAVTNWTTAIVVFKSESSAEVATSPQIIVGRSTSIPSWGSTGYLPFTNHIHNTDSLGARSVWPVSGRLRRLKIRVATAPGSGKSSQYDIQVNEVDSGVTTTIADTATTGQDVANEVYVSAGQRVRFEHTPTNTPTGPGNTGFEFAVEFIPDTPGMSGYATSCYGQVGAGNRYRGLFVPSYTSGDIWLNSNGRENVSPLDCTITAGYILVHTTPPGVGKSYDIYIYKNGIKQDGTGGTVNTLVQVSGTNVTGNASFSLSVSKGDELEVEVIPVGTPANTRLGVSYAVQAANGESVFCGWTGSGFQTSTASSLFNNPSGSNSWGSTESIVEQLVKTAFRVDRLYLKTSTAPGSTSIQHVYVRKNAGDTAIHAQITSAVRIGNDITNSAEFIDTDEICVRSIATVTNAAAGTNSTWSLRVFVQTSHPLNVYAGPDQTVSIAVAGAVQLAGQASGATSYTWSQLSGPSTATFSNTGILNPTVDVNGAAGVYYLQLSATDGVDTVTDTVVITVVGNQAPVVNAGPDQTLAIGDLTAVLVGSATDDGLPASPGTLTYQWTQIAGPYSGFTATWDDDNDPTTNVTLPTPGVYILRLTASDGELSGYDDIIIWAQQAVPTSDKAYRIKINNIDKTDRLLVNDGNIEYPLHQQGSLDCSIIDTGPPATAYRPQLDDVVEVWLDTYIPPWAETPTDTVKAFMGKILVIDETPLIDNEGTRSRISCVDYYRALASKLFTGSFGKFRTIVKTPGVWNFVDLHFANDNTAIRVEILPGAGEFTSPYSIELIDPDANSQSLTVTVPSVGEHVVYLATDGSGNITTTAAQLKTAVEAHADSRVTITHIEGSDGSGVISAKARQVLSGGNENEYEVVEELKFISAFGNPAQILTSYAHGLVPGDFIKFKNTSGTTPDLNDQIYEVEAVQGPTAFTIDEDITISGTGTIVQLVRLNVIIEALAAELVSYGIGLVALASPSPWIEPKDYRNQFIINIVEELMKEALWISRITPEKMWEVFEPGTSLSSIEIREDNKNALYPPTLTESLDNYINQITVFYGPSEEREILDEFIANGTDSSWQLRADFILTYGHLFIDDFGGGFPMGLYGLDDELEWTFDPETKTVYHNDVDFGAVAAGTRIGVPYRGYGQLFVVVPETPPAGEIYEDFIKRDDITTAEAAKVAGQAELDRRNISPRTLTQATTSQFAMPGTAIPVDIPKRLVENEWVVINTSISELGDSKRPQFKFQLLEAGTLENYVEFWKKQFGATL